jgi:hypothetical protein
MYHHGGELRAKDVDKEAAAMVAVVSQAVTTSMLCWSDGVASEGI